MFKYIKYADMLKEIIIKKKQLKQVIYKNKDKQNQTNDVNLGVTYSLLSLVTNNYSKFQEFIQKIQIKTSSTIKNSFLMIVMTAEYVNTGKIQGGGKVKKIIMDNLDLLPEIRRQSKINKQTVQIRLIGQQKLHEQQHIQYSKLKKLFLQKKLIKSHIIPNLYNLTSQQYQILFQSNPQLRESHHLIIQSFSSSLPPFLLLHGLSQSKLNNFNVIDACSAPGNKTVQLGEYIIDHRYKRKVLAFQKDQKRFIVLANTIKRFNKQSNIQTYCENFLQAKPTQPRFKNVKFVMLDPSCSGSGMLSNFLRDQDTDKADYQNMSFQQFCHSQYANLDQNGKQRVQSLHNFQLQLLNHSASFHPIRISYSTCSIYQRQNQDVVSQFLLNHPQYKLKQNKIITENVGKYSICQGFKEFQKCVRLDPRKRQTDGFFVAVFTRNHHK